MLGLGVGLGADVAIMKPAAECACHVESGHGQAFGKQRPGLLLGDAHGEGGVVVYLGFSEHAVLHVYPLHLKEVVLTADDGVLAIGFVLVAEFTKLEAKRLRRVGVALAELLEAEATVAQYLPSDVTGGYDFHSHADHLEGGPMPMLNEVTHELWCRGVVALVGGVGHASAIDNEFLYAEVLYRLGDGAEGGGVQRRTALLYFVVMSRNRLSLSKKNIVCLFISTSLIGVDVA